MQTYQLHRKSVWCCGNYHFLSVFYFLGEQLSECQIINIGNLLFQLVAELLTADPENVESSETQAAEEPATPLDSSDTETSTVTVGSTTATIPQNSKMCQVDIRPSTPTRRMQVAPAHKQAAVWGHLS